MDEYEAAKKWSLYWFNKASDLHGAAAALWASTSTERATQIVEELALGLGYDMHVALPPVYRMICGMSLELLLKATIVAKGGQPGNTHDLVKLATKVGLPLDERARGLFEILADAVIWAGRYPIPTAKARGRIAALSRLVTKHLYDKRDWRGFTVMRRNRELDWESFNRLWGSAMEIYVRESRHFSC